MDSLARENAHPRDAAISFDEPNHLYTIAHDPRLYTSVTTFIGKQLFPIFEEDIVAEICARRNQEQGYKYFGMSKQQILDMWHANGASASGLGTAMHLDIERFFNGVPVNNTSKEFSFFRDFWRDYGPAMGREEGWDCEDSELEETDTDIIDLYSDVEIGAGEEPLQEEEHVRPLVPYRTEWCVYHETYQLAGSIDMIFRSPDGTIQIYDWKRCKHISPEQDNNRYPKFSNAPGLETMPDTHFWRYALQLNMYKYILETQYGETVRGLYLVCMHPNNDAYQRIKLPVLDRSIRAALRYRMATLEGPEAVAALTRVCQERAKTRKVVPRKLMLGDPEDKEEGNQEFRNQGCLL